MPQLLQVYICKTCLKSSVVGKGGEVSSYAQFVADVEDQLNSQDPENKWEVDLSPCMDLCPEAKIAFSIIPTEELKEQIVTVSDEPTASSVVQGCMERIKDDSQAGN